MHLHANNMISSLEGSYCQEEDMYKAHKTGEVMAGCISSMPVGEHKFGGRGVRGISARRGSAVSKYGAWKTCGVMARYPSSALVGHANPAAVATTRLRDILDTSPRMGRRHDKWMNRSPQASLSAGVISTSNGRRNPHELGGDT
jgi:hypothetical protein